MIRHALAAAALLASAPLAAQSASQDEIEARYDRALAAGYKALFLCSAIANAERNGATRTPESVEAWELTGIQAPLDEIVADLPYRILRDPDGELNQVSVEWAGDMPPRVAVHDSRRGCQQMPIGGAPHPIRTKRPHAGSEHIAVVPPTGLLAESLSRAFDGAHGEGTRTTAVLVQRGASTLAEQYAPDFGPAVPQRTWSVAKSIAATLVGGAVHHGQAEVDRSAGLAVAPNDRRRAITIDHLLRMASGRFSDTAGNRTNPLYYGGSSVAETAMHWPLVNAPGTVFRYANNDTLAAVKAIESAFEAQSPAQVFARIGMHDTVAETDWRGDYILSSQVWSTARDLARLGRLYLDDGVLPSGERILPEGWVEYVSSPSGPQPDGPFGYGAGFWLFDKSEGIPPDTFAAMGNRGQFIVIVPSLNTVIVRRGEDPAGHRFDIAGFTRDVLESLAE
ncbi:serine hydrolase [Erythrobacter sp. AP23]|uniref:serine hydrolase domain-containing protein n=1 Tax=Erythrobacter sp. AP23 TaxID=499656 RepID=UPI00076DF41A|nr:serine hydrolase [Erythrobacter sp. AP23]KWV96364.1 serine hydrolase [Erythrobacter sp. AP23]